MAGCVSGFGGLSHVVNVRNEVVLGKIWSQSSVFCKVRFKKFVKEVYLPHVSVKGKQMRLVAMSTNMSESSAELQSGVASSVERKEGNVGSVGKDVKVLENDYEIKTGSDGNGGNGRFNNGGGGGGGSGGGNGDDSEQNDYEEREFGPIMKFEEVMKEVEARGASLPSDMFEAAKSVGIRKLLLLRYFDLQGSSWPLGFLMKSWAMLRNRMLADPSFLFKIGTEIVIDSCCATLAEVQKRGKDFWAEFEIPWTHPTCLWSSSQQGILYGSVGFGCGIIGQGIANVIMTAKRSINKSEEDIPVPPLLKSAALWGVFLAVSSNTRYQVINGLERLVEASPLAKQVPPVAMAFTVGVRFANNIYGGMQFVDWARWSGVQ
ncbi:protein RETICULATA [Citrus sinensis]|uniref:Protein RETICULATA n=1 Tax=Citrus sinensis TaxID=2711 RepID=A0ACB8JUH6_CITSI|nr:protein RETICULATA [Citrus sinensis]